MKSLFSVGAAPRAELLVGNAARAQTFYRELLGLASGEELRLPLRLRNALAAAAQAAATDTHRPQKSRLHLCVGPRLEQALAVAWERGGRIVETERRTELGVWRALITDTEGNLVALYSFVPPSLLESSQ